MRCLVFVTSLLVLLAHGTARADGSADSAGSADATWSGAASPALQPAASVDHEPAGTPAATPAVATSDLSVDGPRYHPLRAQLTVAGLYTAFAGWMYIAWYQHHKDLSQYKFGGDDENCDPLSGSSKVRCVLFGWAGDTTYAGGEDKFGHAWSTMALARLTDELLEQWGGFDHHESMAIGTGLSWLLFVGVEVRDGFNFEFSFSDLGGDTVGALVALALMEWPTLDEMFDFRVQYFPSQMYLRKLDGSSPCPFGGCSRWNIAEDYSGQTYLLAYHLGSIKPLRELKYGYIARFVDVALGFDTRNYKPTPDPGTGPFRGVPTKEGFIGLSLNVQGIFDYLLEDTSHKTLRKVTHGLFEVFNLPYSSVGVLKVVHHPCPDCQITNDGAL